MHKSISSNSSNDLFVEEDKMIIRGEVILGLYIVGMIIACIVGVLICSKKNRHNDDFFIITSQQIENEGIFRYLKIVHK